MHAVADSGLEPGIADHKVDGRGAGAVRHIDAGIQASPVKTRNMINKATSFTTGTDAFTKFFAIIEAATSTTRAHEIMKWLDESELAARAPEAPAEM